MRKLVLTFMLCALTMAWVYTKSTVVLDARTGEKIGVLVTWQADDTEGVCEVHEGRVPWLELQLLLTPERFPRVADARPQCTWDIRGRGR
jgi:hypothetical protein